MVEKYKRVRFKTIFLNKILLKDKKIKQLIKWGNKFAKLGLSPKYDGGSAGNLSFRTKDGFIITSSRSDLSKLNKKDFVKVIDCDLNNKKLAILGTKVPSISREFFGIENCRTKVRGIKPTIFNKKEVFVFGIKEPSSESLLHYSIYKKREDINAVFHCHDDDVLKCSKKMNIPETHKKKFYGTLELAKEAMKILKNNNYIILKGHGIVAMGKTIEETGRLVLNYYKKARKLKK